MALNERWSLDLAYYKTFVKTRNTLSTGQHIDVKLNPDVFTVGLAYRF
ncbi:MAG TPA: OmpW family outer membrane protein [Giesbergeria sp.]|nr:OmpW family outer membrane protein [Giesbergeria sp.]